HGGGGLVSSVGEIIQHTGNDEVHPRRSFFGKVDLLKGLFFDQVFRQPLCCVYSPPVIDLCIERHYRCSVRIRACKSRVYWGGFLIVPGGHDNGTAACENKGKDNG